MKGFVGLLDSCNTILIFFSGEDYIIDDFIKVTPTPGHTLTDVSVLVQTKDDLLIAVTGKS